MKEFFHEGFIEVWDKVVKTDLSDCNQPWVIGMSRQGIFEHGQGAVP